MKYSLVVTTSEVGVIVEADADNVASAVKEARRILGQLGLSTASKPPQVSHKVRSLSQRRILGLGDEYFTEPREAEEIQKELARSGHHYKAAIVRKDLLRLVKKGLLRRIGNGARGNPYKYVNR